MKQARTHAMFSLTVLLACCGCAFALDPSLDISQYAHTSWKVSDGFVKGFVTSIAQTPDGYLWLGTEFGLVRFDGFRAVPWRPPSGEQLPSNTISGLLVARDGTLWIGTFKGLASWKNGKLTIYPELAGLSTFALLEDHEGSVWIGAMGSPTGRLCAISHGTATCYGQDGGFGSGVIGLYEDRKGNLWTGVLKGLWRWKPGISEFNAMPNEENGIRGFSEDDDGNLLIGTTRGLQRFANGKWMPYPIIGPEQQANSRWILRDHNDGLWIGTLDRGIAHVHGGKTNAFTETEGLSGNDVHFIFEDREGSIWVGTEGGLDRFRDYAVTTITTKQGLSSNTTWSVLADGQIVWVGSLKGLNKLDDGRATKFGADGTLNGEPPNFLFKDSSGTLWVSTLHHIGVLKNEHFSSISDWPGGQVHSVVEESPGSFWISSQELGLLHLVGGTVIQRIPLLGLGQTGYVHAIVADRHEGGLWLGFAYGKIAHFFSGAVDELYSADNGLGSGYVNSLKLDSEGALWAGTEGGLSRLRNGSVSTMTTKNGLPCNGVHWVIEDDDRASWLYMPCGLVRIVHSELEAWVADSKRTIQASVFDTSDGVRTSFLAGGYGPKVTRTKDGRLWFVSGLGISTIDPHHIPFNKLPPPVHIEQITADHKTYDVSNGLRMPPHVHDLSIDFTALSLVVPEKVRFRVKLEGQDRDWRELTYRHVHYTNLPPKHYRFRVIACNNSGVWNEEGATLEFVIPPAWYQTNWFRGLCAAALLGLLWAGYRLRVAELEREERRLRETIETLPAMAWVTRPDGTNQFVNRRWLEYTGLSEKGAHGDSWKGLVHPEDVDRYVRRWLAVLARGETFEEEARVRAANGEYRWFLSRAVPLRDNRGKIRMWYGVSTDIEDRKRAEQLQADLAHTNRITMLGELAASISHELKQPIAASITEANTSLRWLKREQPDLDEVRQAVERIVKDGQRATEIIDHLRALYKRTPPKRELVDVNEIIREMVLMLRGEANRFAVSIRTDIAADLPEITADRVQVQQVLMNLMLNGIEAMNETGGVLTIKSEPEDGHVHISVSDTGVGLPADKANKIFDAFYTTKPQGSGMGLAISRSIVESHGGRLWATPNDGRGATFHFTLPTVVETLRVPETGT